MDDTDTLIALVSSLLPQPRTNDAIIDALVQSNGDIESATRYLQSDVGSSKKRKGVDLETWLKPHSKKAKIPESKTSSSSARVALEPAAISPSKHKKPPSSSSLKPTDSMAILRPPPSPRKEPPRFPPMTLSTPELVAQHTPCTLHLSVLPPDLACRLFYTMIDASKEWKRNTWWLFDRVVESPHLTSFFTRRTDGLDNDESWHEAAQFWYNGRPNGVPAPFPPEMEEACKIVERVVNDEMRKRKRYKREWGGTPDGDPLWRANVAASNCYQGGKESVGFHSDQLTYLGPYPTIASLSLGTRRNFSLREVVPTDQTGMRKAQTFNIPLPHNSLTIMHASCQERFKHAIPPQNAIDLFRPTFPKTPNGTVEPSNCRINITFRFYRPDFRPESIPRCKCGVPMALRPDMKNQNEEETDRYWWSCYAGAQNDGKGCKYWKVMDMKGEGRGPYVGDSSTARADENP
ncbi:hypothetical protein NLJ89_g4587 [Agrocybe chaxingu]|uniref:Fe2OG dioxygenase domain-containing protein n=1 Tax=Agrocybe chaxingu TaxID=84603 RepID=A0A9W8K9I1_9AGAR|nr:hypothetical protein NLJ89_g4587 [Agrocybe chaxingu]